MFLKIHSIIVSENLIFNFLVPNTVVIFDTTLRLMCCLFFQEDSGASIRNNYSNRRLHLMFPKSMNNDNITVAFTAVA